MCPLITTWRVLAKTLLKKQSHQLSTSFDLIFLLTVLPTALKASRIQTRLSLANGLGVSLTMPSAPAETNLLPSGEKRTQLTKRLWSWRNEGDKNNPLISPLRDWNAPSSQASRVVAPFFSFVLICFCPAYKLEHCSKRVASFLQWLLYCFLSKNTFPWTGVENVTDVVNKRER